MATNRVVTRRRHLKTMLVLFLAAFAGCNRTPPAPPPQAAPETTVSVRVETPTVRTLVRSVTQPGSIHAYERTPIFAKVPGYVLTWSVDIGSKVKDRAPLAKLWVPELESKLKLKQDLVVQAQKAQALAAAQVGTARAHIKEAEAGLVRARALHDYWDGQNESFIKLVKEKTLDKQSQADAQNQLAQAKGALAEAYARIDTANAMLLEKEAARAKADADIDAAQADVKFQEDVVGYATFVAPYAGVITRRNINTFDFVQPPTAGKGEPLYVIERRDKMRVAVEVPETEAVWVSEGDEAKIRVLALPGKEFTAKVARTSYALEAAPRILVAEIDLDNKADELRPGMYVQATIEGQRLELLTLSAAAVITEGDVNVGYKSYCFIVQEGKLKRTLIEIGARNDRFVEVLKKLVPASATEPAKWVPIGTTEEVVQRDVSGLKDGQTVKVDRSPN